MSNTGRFNVDTIARYLYHLKPDISPLKLQKSLYFLFAYHGALYAQSTEDGTFEGTSVPPMRLFDATFEAWQYGPVIRDVYTKDKRGEYADDLHKITQAVAEVTSEPEIQTFIHELFDQIDSVSDFKLVDRSHEDQAWKDAYRKGQSTAMDNDLIIKEYVDKYVSEE